MPSSYEQGMEEFAKASRKPVGLAIDQHIDPAVKIPAEDQDAMAGLNRRCAEGTKVGISVNEERPALGPFHPPAISTDDEP